MFQKGISQPTRANLALLAGLPEVDNFYLAGGTACALYFGHRFSFDLDFFTEKPFDSPSLAKKIKLEEHGFLVEQVIEDTLLGKLNGEKISFFLYQYPLLKPTKRWRGINVAHIFDLAAMKIEAISGRGRKRDFIDLYLICKELGIKRPLELYDQKYKALASNFPHLIKALTYFADAEGDDMPQMIEKISWEEVKAFFEEEVKRLSRKLLGLKDLHQSARERREESKEQEALKSDKKREIAS